jgi:hypothetical protein
MSEQTEEDIIKLYYQIKKSYHRSYYQKNKSKILADTKRRYEALTPEQKKERNKMINTKYRKKNKV